MEFREFVNPENADYDVKKSFVGISSGQYKTRSDQYLYEQLFDLIGVLDDIDEEQLIEMYGITMAEYLKPTSDTIKKVYERVSGTGRCRIR